MNTEVVMKKSAAVVVVVVVSVPCSACVTILLTFHTGMEFDHEFSVIKLMKTGSKGMMVKMY
jgi:hypothetical protein